MSEATQAVRVVPGRRRAVLLDVVTSLVLAALVVLPHPGRTTFDTKLDLTVDPMGFLLRSLQVWNPQGGLGELQNQAVGYLFPIGPFFALGDAVGLPGWLVQRSWQTLLLVGAYVGTRRLVERLGLGTGWAAWLGALAYALCPRMLTTLGPISAEALAVTMLPWIMLPLVQPERAGSPRRAAARSAAAVLLLGGVNGAVTLAVLPLPVLWLATRRPGQHRRRLVLWWGALTAAACAWWFLPLTVLGRYSPPFLDHIETADSTTTGITPFEALRGTTHWVAYFTRSGEPWWPAGWELVTNPWMVLSTVLVAGVGMLGLSRRDMPERRPLVLAVAAGLLLLALGGVAAGATPLGELWRTLLDGALVPFRNIHKFDPVLRLPLALGLVHAVQVLIAGVRGRTRHDQVGPRTAPVLRVVAVGVVVTAVVGSAWPLVSGRLRPGPSWVELPSSWQQAADYLAAESEGTTEDGGNAGLDSARALLVPSSGFGEYVWGRTVDEPMQPLARSAWAVRNQAPLSAPGTVRLLDSVDRALGTGRPSAGLAGTLSRSGIRFLVVRNDLDWTKTGSPRPEVVHAVLDQSPGLRRVASFGPAVASGEPVDGRVLEHGLGRTYPSIEIYQVSGERPRVRAVAADEVAVLSGGPESLLPAIAAGVLEPGRPVVLTGDDPPTGPERWLLTDGLRRRDRDVGRVQANLSNTLTEDEPSSLSRRVSDVLPFDADGHQTVARLSGVSTVRASSSAGSGATLGPTRPEHQPFAALDGNPATSWRSDPLQPPVGQSLQIVLPSARDLTGLRLTMEHDRMLGPRVTTVRVTTDHGERLTRLEAAGETVLDVPPGATKTVTVTVAGTEPGQGAVGILELALPGVVADRTLQLPSDVPTVLPAGRVAPDAVVLSDDMPPRRACVPTGPDRPEVVACDPFLKHGSEDGGELDRTVDLHGPASYSVTAMVVPRGQERLARYLDPLGRGVTGRASSVLGDDLAVRAGAALDGDPATGWVASPDDPAPELALTWSAPRTLSSVRVLGTQQPASARPQRLQLTAADKTWTVDLTGGDTARFPPVETSSITVRVLSWERRVSLDRATGLLTRLPPGIAELQLDGLPDLSYRPAMTSRIGQLCGTGPNVLVDGRKIPTQITATLGDLLAGRPVTAQPCRGQRVALDAGRHHVTTQSDDWFVIGLALRGRDVDTRPVSDVPADAGSGLRSTTVSRWTSAHREVEVAAGERALLVVPESQNDGWVATSQGSRLQRATVDGWQQAWVLPAGGATTVVLEYLPQRTHLLGLGVGAVLAALVVALALLPARPGGRSGAGTATPLTAPPLRAAPRRASRFLGLLALVVPVLLAGWVGLGCLLVGLALRRTGSAVVGWVVVLCPMAAALLVAAAGRGAGVQSSSLPAQVLVLVPLSILVATLTSGWSARHRAKPTPRGWEAASRLMRGRG